MKVKAVDYLFKNEIIPAFDKKKLVYLHIYLLANSGSNLVLDGFHLDHDEKNPVLGIEKENIFVAEIDYDSDYEGIIFIFSDKSCICIDVESIIRIDFHVEEDEVQE